MLTKAGFARLEAALTPQPYVIIRGGLVQNDPGIPVLDMGALESDYIDEGTIEEVNDVRTLAIRLHLTGITAECDTWLTRHDPTTYLRGRGPVVTTTLDIQ